jgi:hypothetical protein
LLSRLFKEKRDHVLVVANTIRFNKTGKAEKNCGQKLRHSLSTFSRAVQIFPVSFLLFLLLSRLFKEKRDHVLVVANTIRFNKTGKAEKNCGQKLRHSLSTFLRAVQIFPVSFLLFLLLSRLFKEKRDHLSVVANTTTFNKTGKADGFRYNNCGQKLCESLSDFVESRNKFQWCSFCFYSSLPKARKKQQPCFGRKQIRSLLTQNWESGSLSDFVKDGKIRSNNY